jgi:hypothetical protein
MSSILDDGKAGHPAAALPSTSPARPGYVLATPAHARVGWHIHVPGASHRFEER